MKNKALFALFIFLTHSQFITCLDFTLKGGVDYTSYPPGNKSFVGNVFTPEFLPIIYAGLSNDISGKYNYNINFDYDPIWRNTISGDIGYYLGNIDIKLGFFIGAGDFTFTSIDAGFSGKAGVEFPGIFMANAGISSSIGGSMDSPENTTRQLFSAQAGFWLPNIFITFDFDMKDYIEQVTETLKIQTNRKRYKGAMEIFSKNTPYRIRFDFGWQDLIRLVNDNGPIEEEGISTLFVGARFYSQVSNIFAWFVEGEVPFNIDDLTNIKILYNASIGVIFSHPDI
ncbi:MAG: hypothetical protein LBB22_01275 [Treponema sp.]|jgi:hypothetical protein|nr:hypothetical protein [Treponema sp.]